ncbi:hypothetical protein J2T19_001209 [Paenibacillus tundrae]|uniref:Uncharacterized protein n=1 Tax=Paenibacillus tundrae TaxID=528187 RepID=A0ABT9W974_9BACL|nr:hypothetical protein [Paenibacillus tundrae]
MPPRQRRKLPPFAKRSREPGQGAKPCPQRQRRKSSRPSRSGAGSLGKERSLPPSAKGAKLPPFAKRSREPRARGEALPPAPKAQSSRPSRSGAGSPGQEAKPCPQRQRRKAPALREAEQGAPGKRRSLARNGPSKLGQGRRYI